MYKKDKYYLIIISILVITLIIFKGCEKPQQPINHYTYTTDTLYHAKKYEALLTKFSSVQKDLKKLKETPPKTINYYTTPNPETITIEKVPDSLILYIEDLKEKIAISDKYIKNYPKNDKLIDFQLTRDSLDIATLTIKGDTKKQTFPMYLDNYNYFWAENRLLRKDRKSIYKYKDPNKWNQLFFKVGYDLLYFSPNLGLDYHIDLGRFRLQAESNMLIISETPFTFNINLGYRLLK